MARPQILVEWELQTYQEILFLRLCVRDRLTEAISQDEYWIKLAILFRENNTILFRGEIHRLLFKDFPM